MTAATTKAEAVEALDTIKERFKTPGCCRALSLGPACECILCLCDRVRDFIEAEKKCVHEMAREFGGACKAHLLNDCRTCAEQKS